MSSIMIKTLIVLLLTTVATPAWATGIAFSEAQLDWTGLQFTLSSGLTVTRIDRPSALVGSHAVTTLGEDQRVDSIREPVPPADTLAASGYTNPAGFAQADASTTNGLLMSMATAGATLLSSLQNNVALSSSYTSSSFWLYGNGIGTMTVSIPYQLSVGSTETPPLIPEIGRTFAETATARAQLVVGPDVRNNGGSRDATLAWSSADGAGIQTTSGLFTVTRTFNNPYWGPLTSIHVGVTTIARAVAVPEPSSWLLLGLALVGLVGWRLQQRRRARDDRHRSGVLA